MKNKTENKTAYTVSIRLNQEEFKEYGKMGKKEFKELKKLKKLIEKKFGTLDNLVRSLSMMKGFANMSLKD